MLRFCAKYDGGTADAISGGGEKSGDEEVDEEEYNDVLQFEERICGDICENSEPRRIVSGRIDRRASSEEVGNNSDVSLELEYSLKLERDVLKDDEFAMDRLEFAIG